MEHAPVDYKLLISLIAVYGVLLLYVYQFGFFSIVGFEHAGLTSPLDIWSNAAFILAYAIPTAMASLLVIMLIQYSAQFGFNVVRWIADHEAPLTIAVVIITIIPLTVRVFLKKNPHLFFASIILNFVNNSTIVYCNLVSYQRFPFWTFVIALIALIALAACIGIYSAYYARVLELNKFDIILEDGRLDSVRLVRGSSAGIIYADGASMSFVNLGKVVRIVPAE